MTMTKPKLLVSACLLGENCKYSGGNNRNEQVRALERYFQLIPVCPECFGGLPIPREPSEIRDGCVVSKSGVDVTAAFADGAEKTLYIAAVWRFLRSAAPPAAATLFMMAPLPERWCRGRA